MEKENKNKVSGEQKKAAGKKKKEVLAIYNKMIAFANNITDEYNDDPDLKASHALLSFGVFMRRLENEMNSDDAHLKSGDGYVKPDYRIAPHDAFAEMTAIIKKGYELTRLIDISHGEGGGNEE